jgi:hypothetical protein
MGFIALAPYHNTFNCIIFQHAFNYNKQLEVKWEGWQVASAVLTLGLYGSIRGNSMHKIEPFVDMWDIVDNVACLGFFSG